MTDENNLQLSAALTQVIVRGLQEFIGQPDLDKLFQASAAFPFRDGESLLRAGAGLAYAEIPSLAKALEEVYGAQGARGVALRSGRSAFCYFLKTFGDETGFNGLEFRLLPPRRRMYAGLQRLAEVISSQAGQPVSVRAEEQAWLVQIDACPECWQQHSAAAVCYFSVGFLQEFLSWLSGGRVYLVEETACRAKGDPACILRIDQKPLD